VRVCLDGDGAARRIPALGGWTVQPFSFPPPPGHVVDPGPPAEDVEALLERSPPYAPEGLDRLHFRLHGWHTALSDVLPAGPDGPRFPDLPGEGFGLVAEAEVDLPAGRWLLRAVCDDGARVYLDGERVIDDWVHGGVRERLHGFGLAAPRRVAVRVEFFDDYGDAVLEVGLYPD